MANGSENEANKRLWGLWTCQGERVKLQRRKLWRMLGTHQATLRLKRCAALRTVVSLHFLEQLVF
jgi:hypothetical protein